MSNSLILEEVKPEQLTEQVNRVLGAASGRLLRFRDAVLARAESNKNGDDLDAQGLAEVAATLPLLPIDEEHRQHDIRGYYIDARADDALHTDGIIFAGRFPKVAEGIQDGTYHLSIEATAKEAECSICHRVFASESDYCSHLNGRPASGARRILRGLHAIGGAVTKTPAGSNTSFDPSQITVFASLAVRGQGAEDNQNVEGNTGGEKLSFFTELEYALWKGATEQFNAFIGKQLAYRERENLGDSDFALIQKKDGKTLRRFPIHDCAHARNALARLSGAQDLSDEERAMVKRKANTKLNSEECMKQAPSREENAAKAAQQFMTLFANLFPSAAVEPAQSVSTPPAQPSPQTGLANDSIAAMGQVKQELLAKIAELEQKLTAAQAAPAQSVQASQTPPEPPQPKTGVVGLSWNVQPPRESEPLTARW